jgi:RNA methyltransferase, TrmH family
MLSKVKIQYLQSLQQKKFRQKYNVFVAEGEKICAEIIEQQQLEVEGVFALSSWLQANKTLLSGYKKEFLHEIEDADLKKISSLTTPNQVLIVAKQPAHVLDKGYIAQDLSLFLDGIQDPGNLGTILRIADWFGIQWVFCAPNTVEIYNPKVVQASMGAFLRIKTQTIEMSAFKTLFPNTNIYGAVLGGTNIFTQTFPQNALLVIGNEGNGISASVQAQLTQGITIPAYGNGAESLNAAIATGIICAVLRNHH